MKSAIETFPDDSRVWVYQADKPIPNAISDEVRSAIGEFTKKWISHSRQLAAAGDLVGQRFVVLMVDDSKIGPSGCSIDASVRFLRELGGKLDVDFFDRLTFAYEKDGMIRTIHKSELAEAYRKGEINDDTVVYDNLVKTKGEFSRAWKKRFGESWMKRFV